MNGNPVPLMHPNELRRHSRSVCQVRRDKQLLNVLPTGGFCTWCFCCCNRYANLFGASRESRNIRHGFGRRKEGEWNHTTDLDNKSLLTWQLKQLRGWVHGGERYGARSESWNPTFENCGDTWTPRVPLLQMHVMYGRHAMHVWQTKAHVVAMHVNQTSKNVVTHGHLGTPCFNVHVMYDMHDMYVWHVCICIAWHTWRVSAWQYKSSCHDNSKLMSSQPNRKSWWHIDI